MSLVDLENTFNRINREDVWKVLQTIGVDKNAIEVRKDMYKNNNFSHGEVSNRVIC